ncbi:MAG TPA: phage tail protein [Mucilaginibacter sp.]|jgi:phage tail-like protein|nr:phage tail protein [Mucilaginibacter sp.]
MAGDAQNNIWPLPKFRFSVDWGTSQTNLAFQEVTGLEAETQVLEYRHSTSATFSTIKMPGIAKYGNVTMKRGTFVKDNAFFDWYSKIKMNTIERINIIIKLLDEKGNPTMTWTLTNAWPTKVTGTDLKSEGNEIAIESIEIAHEGLTVTNK